MVYGIFYERNSFYKQLKKHKCQDMSKHHKDPKNTLDPTGLIYLNRCRPNLGF